MTRRTDDFCIKGSLIDGLEIDLVALAGLDLTDDERDRLWEAINERDLLTDELLCAEIDLYETDGAPGISDRYVEYRCGPRKDFVKRLRAALLKYCSPQASASGPASKRRRTRGSA
jgi:hypothetical protein